MRGLQRANVGAAAEVDPETVEHRRSRRKSLEYLPDGPLAVELYVLVAISISSL